MNKLILMALAATALAIECTKFDELKAGEKYYLRWLTKKRYDKMQTTAFTTYDPENGYYMGYAETNATRAPLNDSAVLKLNRKSIFSIEKKGTGIHVFSIDSKLPTGEQKRIFSWNENATTNRGYFMYKVGNKDWDNSDKYTLLSYDGEKHVLKAAENYVNNPTELATQSVPSSEKYETAIYPSDSNGVTPSKFCFQKVGIVPNNLKCSEDYKIQDLQGKYLEATTIHPRKRDPDEPESADDIERFTNQFLKPGQTPIIVKKCVKSDSSIDPAKADEYYLMSEEEYFGYNPQCFDKGYDKCWSGKWKYATKIFEKKVESIDKKWDTPVAELHDYRILRFVDMWQPAITDPYKIEMMKELSASYLRQMCDYWGLQPKTETKQGYLDALTSGRWYHNDWWAYEEESSYHLHCSVLPGVGCHSWSGIVKVMEPSTNDEKEARWFKFVSVNETV